MREEREGRIRVEAVLNDGARNSMILLTGLKNIFQKQLPNMPKDYIARLVYDRNHCSIALIRNPNKVIGGICYRPFNTQEFAEIVFCAIASTDFFFNPLPKKFIFKGDSGRCNSRKKLLPVNASVSVRIDNLL